jgi:signal transduction histidine kinase
VAESWWRRGSVRARTTLLSATVSGGALLLGAVLLLLSLDRSLHASGDDLARGRVDELATLSRTGALPPILSAIGGEGVGQVFADDGTVVAASPNIVGRLPLTRSASSRTPEVRVLHNAPDDAERESYRVWTVRVATPTGPVTVVAGFSLESVGEAASTLQRDLAVGVPLLVLLVAAGTWLVIGRTLRPVEGIRAEVAAISEDGLDRRVPVPATGDEVSRLATTMNAMLDRLQEGSRRQRAFVADASHELQSPLTALRSQLEVALAQRDNDWEATARSLLVDTDEMERLVRDLLYLARSQEATAPPGQALLDLDDVVLEEVTRLRGTTDV